MTEEDVTGALIRALKGNERNVCVVQGSGEHSLDETGASGISVVKQLLEGNNYKTQALNLLRKPEIGKECTVLLVAGPSSTMSSRCHGDQDVRRRRRPRSVHLGSAAAVEGRRDRREPVACRPAREPGA